MDLKIGVIISSDRPTRSGDKVANWFLNQVKDAEDVEFDLIDLAEINLPFLNEPNLPAQGNYQHKHTAEWSEMIAGYDAFVIVAAEYNHGYTAVIKNALDSLHAEWGRKPVAFVGYGSLGGARAIEQLVQVTAQLNMVPLPSTAINIIDVWAAFNDKDAVKPEHVRGSADKLLDNLLWWATTLKTAKTSELASV